MIEDKNMEDHKEVQSFIHHLEDKQEREQSNLDRVVLLVSAGLVIVFVNYLGAFGGNVVGPLWAIKLALFSAITAIAMQIIAYLVSTNLNRYAVDVNAGTKRVKSVSIVKKRVSRQNLTTTLLNHLASLAILSALILSAYFVSKDLGLRNPSRMSADVIEEVIEVR